MGRVQPCTLAAAANTCAAVSAPLSCQVRIAPLASVGVTGDGLFHVNPLVREALEDVQCQGKSLLGALDALPAITPESLLSILIMAGVAALVVLAGLAYLCKRKCRWLSVALGFDDYSLQMTPDKKRQRYLKNFLIMTYCWTAMELADLTSDLLVWGVVYENNAYRMTEDDETLVFWCVAMLTLSRALWRE